MPVPDFSPGEVLTAAAMDSIGLWLVKTVNFSGATAATPVNVLSCFSSNYTNYKVVVNTSAATANVEIELQFLSGTTPATAANYRFAAAGSTSAAAASNNGSLTNTSIGLTLTAQNGTVGASVELFQPQKAIKTNFYGDWFYDDGGVLIYRRFGGVHNLANAYDGFRLFTASGNITGTVKVYGYRD